MVKSPGAEPVPSNQRSKPTALQAFELNIADAEQLVAIARLLRNERQRRMRKELQERIGIALRVAQRDRSELECLENDQVFVTFRPGSAHLRENLKGNNLDPLLRQAIVATCAAVETYVADRVMENYASACKIKPLPPRLSALSITIADYHRIETTYARKGWGLRQLVELRVREQASPTPSVIGELFSMVGHSKGLLAAVDSERKVPKGTSAGELDQMRDRRNRIAHAGDRQGRSRASIEASESDAHISAAREIVKALERVTIPGSQRVSA
jgi:hypothetical protein